MSDSSDQAAPTGAESQSIADRIADAFLGKEPPEPQEAPPEPETQPVEADQAEDAADAPDAPEEGANAEEAFAEIEIDGKQYQVPEALKKAFIQQADYTRKTQEVAEQRRLVDFQRQQVALAESERKFGELVRDELSQMSTLDAALKQYEALDWRNLSTDEMIRYKVEIDQLKERKANIERGVQQKHGQWQQEVQRAHAQLLQQGMEAVKKAIPNFNDATIQEIKDYALSEGYTPEEIGNILDPRQVKTLWEAAQYRKLRTQKAPTAQKLAQARPIGKPAPSARPMDQATRDRLAFSKAKGAARSSAERAKVIEAYLAKTF